jgi:hypothetical protein
VGCNSEIAKATWIALVGLAACGDDSGYGPPPVAEGDGGTEVSASSFSDGPGAGTSTEGTADATAGSDGGPENCADMVCSGHANCVMEADGAICVCDDGYVLDESSGECVVDESCVQVRHLESHCRQIYNGAPAVATFFAVDFCSGTAVLPEKFAELGLEFHVLENGVDIAENVESYSSIIEKGVESYVTVALDLSDSLVDRPEFPMLVDELRGLMSSIESLPGEAPIYVSLYVFGRNVEEYVPFTRDFAAMDAALAAIASDPTPAQALAGGGSGTDLYDAVELAINRTQRIRDLRDAVTFGGVLSTGTVVVVSDANDTSNGQLNQSVITNTVNNVISVGVSNDIEPEDLQAIGRDGSFLAPTPSDWTTAFDEIAVRVDQYPQRSYLLAYCSSATEGDPDVEVRVVGAGVITRSGAACQFTADYFGANGEVCDQALFDAACGGVECGGLTACGACADTECCDGSTCQAPETATQAGIACEASDICNEAGEVCDGDPAGECVPPIEVGDPCDPDDSLCLPGATYCDEDSLSCLIALPLGALCTDDLQCDSLNCSRDNPDNPFEDETCRHATTIYDVCGAEGGLCEEGAYCSGSRCEPKKFDSETCSSPNECRHAACVDIGRANVCDGPAACYWAWDEKVPG